MHVSRDHSNHLAAAQTRTRAAKAGVVAGGAGVVVGWLIPRGPVTTVETLSAVVVTFVFAEFMEDVLRTTHERFP